jgi:cytochrome P450
MHVRAEKFLENKNSLKNDEKAESSKPQLFDVLYASSLPPSEKTVDHLAQHGFGLIGAGGETIARVLSQIIFFVLDTPGVNEKLKTELKTAMPDKNGELPDLKELKALPWLVRYIPAIF